MAASGATAEIDRGLSRLEQLLQQQIKQCETLLQKSSQGTLVHGNSVHVCMNKGRSNLLNYHNHLLSHSGVAVQVEDLNGWIMSDIGLHHIKIIGLHFHWGVARTI